MLDKTKLRGIPKTFLRNYDFSKYRCPNCKEYKLKYFCIYRATDMDGNTVEGSDIILHCKECRWASSIHEDEIKYEENQ